MGFFKKLIPSVAKAVKTATAKDAAGAKGMQGAGSIGMLAMAKKPGKFSGVAGALTKAMGEKAQQGGESMPVRSKGMGPIGNLMQGTATKTPMQDGESMPVRSKGRGLIGKLMQAKATKTPMFKKGGAVAKKTGKGKAMGIATRGGGRALMKGK